MSEHKSILLFGEGKTEAVFLAHLRDLFRSPRMLIKVEHGRGGCGRTVVLAAINAARLADYDEVIILLDSDREEEEIPSKWYADHPLTIKRSLPCLEALLLDILRDETLPRLRHGANASDRCKSRFWNTYLGTDRSSQVIGRLKNLLQKQFTKELLIETRRRIPALHEILHSIEGGTRERENQDAPQSGANCRHHWKI